MRFAVLTAGLAFALSVQAQTYPAKPVRLVIPFAAGGGNDIVARVIGQRLSSGLGQPFIIENRPGNNGFIGGDAVAKAAPDGYSMLMGPSGPTTIGASIFSKMPYHPLKDLAPITMIGTFPLILVVAGGSPHKTVGDLVAFAKANPGKANYGSTAATFQLVSELFNQKTGTQFQHIPYKSSADFNTAVMTGEITIAFTDPPPTLGMLKSGKLRALAVTTAKRHPQLPDVPTLMEAGIKEMEAVIFMGLFFPAGTPGPIITRVRDEVAKGITEGDVKEKLAALGVEPDGRSPEEFAKFLAADLAKWTAVAKAANIKGD
jgi:tripartite-type tricarboxylate transporter receptor subunit TctC